MVNKILKFFYGISKLFISFVDKALLWVQGSFGQGYKEQVSTTRICSS